MMNTRKISAVILLGLTLAISGQVLAHNSKHEHKKERFMKAFSQLDLSEQQKQNMKSLVKQTREENALYRADRQKFKAQTQQLMNLPAWDQDFATSLVQAQMQHGQAIQLNRAKTQHQLFNMLTSEQQAEFLANAEKRKQRMQDRMDDRKNEVGQPKLSRLTKALNLTDEQLQAISQSRKSLKSQRVEHKDEFSKMREQSVALIQAKEFDEKAWMALQEQNMAFKTQQRVEQLKAQYEMLVVLTEQQKKKFKKIMKKVKEKNGGRF